MYLDTDTWYWVMTGIVNQKKVCGVTFLSVLSPLSVPLNVWKHDFRCFFLYTCWNSQCFSVLSSPSSKAVNEVLILRTIWVTFSTSNQLVMLWMKSEALVFHWGTNNSWMDPLQLHHLQSVRLVCGWLKGTGRSVGESKQLSVGVRISWPCSFIILL